MIKLSIITVCYNAEKTIKQTIDSVVRQSYKNIEYIIIDGASTDDTLKIVNSYKEDISIIISEKDSGIYNAMNKGIDLASGDYIYFLGADDCFFNYNVVENVVKQLDCTIDLLSAQVWMVQENNYQSLCTNNHARDKHNYFGGMVPHQGLICKTSIMKKYHFDEKYKIASDYKFFLQCYQEENFKIKFIDDIIAYYDGNGVSSLALETTKEYSLIHQELNLPFRVGEELRWKKIVKKVLFKIGVLDYIRNLYRINFLWYKHHCNNRICRWCGRQ